MTDFVHLNIHSEYSIKDSLIRIPKLIAGVRSSNMPAVALTDVMNLFGVVKFYKAAVSAGVKPIIGAELIVEMPTQTTPCSCIALCQNDQGYRHLIQLISLAYEHADGHHQPMIKSHWFADHSDGLILLSGGVHGNIGQALLQGKVAEAKAHLSTWLSLFPNRFYIELHRTGHATESTYIPQALALARETDTPVVATNAVRFMQSTDFEAHEVRVCIHGSWLLDDQRREKTHSDQQYLRSTDEMVDLFRDIPEAIHNTVEIARRCNARLTFGKVFLPDFPLKDAADVSVYLTQFSTEALNRYLESHFDSTSPEFAAIQTQYHDRLTMELNTINRMGFPGYFLIVSDFVQWSKDHDIAVGPGRGSGAGSLVAFLLKITGLDPIEHQLLFERFLNPERVSMPDFDIDFCVFGRDRVIDYVVQKYGVDRVSQIITFGRMAAKAVVRDVGRVLGYSYGYVDKLAKLIPFELGITLNDALEKEPILKQRYDDEEDVRLLMDLAKKLEGLTRNAGKHAGGVVIAPSALTDFTPLYRDKENANLVSQFDKDDVDAIGLVKFDFLGLRTLSIINWAVQMVNERRKRDDESLLDIDTLPLEDVAVFDLLKSGQVTAIFQLDKSRGMQDLIIRLQPDCFEEIVALVALFRPGPLQSGMVDDFVQRKHGKLPIEYPHPWLEPILKPTYGVILYQEQVMKIAQVLANYSLGGADLLRRAMGKKKPQEMAKQRKIFVEGALKNGIEEATSNYIFDLMEKFAGYGFNRSHSAGYALISYQTAWLKAHYPKAFMASMLSSDMDNTDKVFLIMEACRSMKLTVLRPNINTSLYRFSLFGESDDILYGMGAVKGVGEAAVEHIIENRTKNGLFKDLFDFCQRLDLRKVNRRVLEALVKSGAMDDFDVARSILFASIDRAISHAERCQTSQSCGQRDIFDRLSIHVSVPDITYIEAPSWTKKEALQAEKETLGYYFSGHPLEYYQHELPFLANVVIENLAQKCGHAVRIVGLITGIRIANTQRQQRMAFVTLADLTGQVEVAIFSDLYQSGRELLNKDQIVIVEGDVSVDDYRDGFRLRAKQVMDITTARMHQGKCLLIDVMHTTVSPTFAKDLAEVLKPYQQQSALPVYIQYRREGMKVRLPLGNDWQVTPKDELLESLRQVFPDVRVDLVY